MKKKFLRILVIISIIMCAALPLVGCNRNPLDAPVNLKVDDAVSVLSWDSVVGARGYTIEIEGNNGYSETTDVRKVSYGISYLTSDVTYTFKVKAIGDKVNYSNSDWSQEFTVFKPFENGLAYKAINSNSAYEVSGIGTATRYGNVVTIPAMYRGKPVTRIGNSSFYNNSRVTEVIIPDSVTEIGTRAFHNCISLTRVEMPDSVVSIGEKAFQSCSSLKTVKLSQNLAAIPASAFYGCRVMTSVDFGENSKVESIGADAFWQCTNLGTTTDAEGNITAHNAITLPESLLKIDESAFANCTNITELNIGNNVSYIGASAFHNCEELSDINLGNSLLEIADNAFFDCVSLVEVDLPNSVTTIGSNVFQGCTLLEDVNLGNQITSIGRDIVVDTVIWENAVVNSKDEVAPIYIDGWLIDTKFPAIDVTLPDPNVGPQKFYIQDGTIGIAAHAVHCTVVSGPETEEGPEAYGSAIEEVYIPASVKVIGNDAFVDSRNLVEVVIGTEEDGSQTKIIGDQAFCNCTHLSEVTIHGNSLETIGNEAFRNCYVLGASRTSQDDASIVQQIKLPESLRSIGTNAFLNTHFYTHYEGGVVYVGGWVIDFDSEEATSATVDAEVRSTSANGVETITTIGIANYAFYKKEALTQVVLPDTIKYFGKSAFYKSNALTSIRIPALVTEIPDYTFYNCTALSEVDLNNVTKIGLSAFYNAGSAPPTVDAEGNSTGGSFTITNTEQVESIGNNAFYNVPYLDRFTFGENLSYLGSYAFAGTSLKSVVIPDNTITAIGDYTFTTCVYLTSVSLGEGITSIGRYAFNKNVALEEISLPSTLVSIGDYAFKEASSLKEIKLTEGLETIGKSAFVNCTSLTDINLPTTLTSVGNFAFRGCTGFTAIKLSSEIDSLDMHVFYGAKVTFYTDATAIPAGWHLRWNSSSRPVVLGCTFSEDGEYIVSFTKSAATLTNIFSYNKEADVTETDEEGNVTVVKKISDPIASPICKGYIFVGWATEPNGTKAYETKYLYEVEDGTVLYAIWEAEASEDDGETPDDDTSGDETDDDTNEGGDVVDGGEGTEGEEDAE
ncbi:MAG: leucine-rich repeat protein [Clostridia bacterium]|nr:leucine-rich repeat protein [Clostridia bacterium]